MLSCLATLTSSSSDAAVLTRFYRGSDTMDSYFIRTTHWIMTFMIHLSRY